MDVTILWYGGVTVLGMMLASAALELFRAQADMWVFWGALLLGCFVIMIQVDGEEALFHVFDRAAELPVSVYQLFTN